MGTRIANDLAVSMNASVTDFLTLMLFAIPVACIAWTVTHEEIFREIREYFKTHSKTASSWYGRKFFYALTCEYCFSHYVAIGLVALTQYKLLIPDWRGYLISVFSVVWFANFYMSLYNRLRVDIKTETLERDIKQSTLEKNRNHFEELPRIARKRQ